MFVATLIAAEILTRDQLCEARERLHAAGCEPDAASTIEPERAADLPFAGDPAAARATLEAMDRVDIVVQPLPRTPVKLLVADMDSTMITVECIDELADYAGVKAAVADVTERAMRGELDFAGALEARVALLKGLDEAVLDRCHAERVRIMPGARTLVRTLKSRGARAILVSGGFTLFAEKVAQEIGFDRAHANRLNLAGGILDGTVAKPILGAEAKRETLLAAMAESGLARAETLAIGDGANDIPMLREAGLGIAYHAKPAAAAAANGSIGFNDLSAILYALGMEKRDWIT